MIRLLQAALIATVAAFAVAFLFRHAKHGAALAIGNVAWLAFLLGALCVVALAIAAGVRRRVSSS